MKRRILAAGAVLMLVAGLVGCADESDAGEISDRGTAERRVQLSDGRTVSCVVWKQGYAGGLSCDWAGAK